MASSSFHSSAVAGNSFPSQLLHRPIEAISPLVVPLMTLATVATLGLVWLYRGEIQVRLRKLQKESWIFGVGVTMERVETGGIGKDSTMFANLHLLELNPEFVADCKEKGWSVYSLGDYLSTLRPKQLPKNFDMKHVPDLIQREVEAGIAAALLKVLGPNLGRAVLPLTGLGPIQRRVQRFASDVITKWFLSESGSLFESKDKGGIPVSLMTLLAAADLNARVNLGKEETEPVPMTGFSNMNLTAIEKMKTGEVVKGPSFACSDADSRGCLMPKHEFIMDRDFDRIIKALEVQLVAQQNEATGQTDTLTQMLRDEMEEEINGEVGKKKATKYDPDDRSMPEPVPINPRLFPGLHLGYGKAISSHTKREVMKMRLLSVLMNRLGSNYYRMANGETDNIFQVRMANDSKPISTPADFVHALIDSGHEVEVVPTTHLTTFGVNLCVKEEDGSWSNIPLAAFLESGYEDREGRMAPAMMPHSGLDMFVSGPLAGTRSDGAKSMLRIQHFNGIEGFCGWQPNEHPEIPYNVDVETGPRLKGNDAVRAARIAALYATTLNGLSSELNLPFGGYGLTAVCNDSAALVQQCLYGVTTIYPMTSVGRFLQRTMRYAQRLEDIFRKHKDLEREVEDLQAITSAMKKIPSDLNASPANATSAARRMLATLQPNLPFVLAKDSQSVMESILHEEESASAKRSQHHSFLA